MTKKIVFFRDLSEEAKEKARQWFRDGNDMSMLGSYLTGVIKEKLEDEGFEVIGKYADGHLTGCEDLKILYSLSYCQGDGVSFEGTLKRDGITYNVEQHGMYVHEYSLSVTAYNANDEKVDDVDEALKDMQAACRETERVGYEEIDYENSAEYIDEVMEANKYTFSVDGERLDPDNI